MRVLGLIFIVIPKAPRQVHTWPNGLSQSRGLKVIIPFFTLSFNPHTYPRVKNTTVNFHHGILYGHARNTYVRNHMQKFLSYCQCIDIHSSFSLYFPFKSSPSFFWRYNNCLQLCSPVHGHSSQAINVSNDHLYTKSHFLRNIYILYKKRGFSPMNNSISKKEPLNIRLV